MTDRSPPLTVSVSAYNEEKRIARCLTNLLAQTYRDFRIIVLDNGSTDRTVEIAREFAARDARISVRWNYVNVGPIQNFVKSQWVAESEFVMLASANDYLDPEYTQSLMDCLRADESTGIAYTKMSADNAIPHYFQALSESPLERATTVMAEFMSGHALYGIIRRRIIDMCSPLASRMSADHVIVAEAALYGRIRCIDKPYYHRTPHPGRTSGGNARLMSDYGHKLIEDPAPLDGELGVVPPYLELLHCHFEMIDRARITNTDKKILRTQCAAILRHRFGKPMLEEIKSLLERTAAYLKTGTTRDPGSYLHGIALMKALHIACIAIPETRGHVLELSRPLAALLNAE